MDYKKLHNELSDYLGSDFINKHKNHVKKYANLQFYIVGKVFEVMSNYCKTYNKSVAMVKNNLTLNEAEYKFHIIEDNNNTLSGYVSLIYEQNSGRYTIEYNKSTMTKSELINNIKQAITSFSNCEYVDEKGSTVVKKVNEIGLTHINDNFYVIVKINNGEEISINIQ